MLKPVAASYIYRMKDREPVHVSGQERIFFKNDIYTRTMYWPDIGLITHHDPIEKQRVLKRQDVSLGEFGNKFLKAKGLDYYNRGLNYHMVTRNGEKIWYGD